MRCVLAIIAAMLAAYPGVAAPPPGIAPDSGMSQWFQELRQPGPSGMPCCSISDCRKVEFRMTDTDYEILIEGTWHRVPSSVILRQANPVGKAVACYRPHVADEAGRLEPVRILCFVPEALPV